MSLVSVEQVSLAVRRRRLLDEVSFTVEPGRSLAVVGPNGSGKTALLRILATAARPTQGNVRIDGLDTLRDAPTIRRRIGYMPDQYGRYPNLSVYQYVDFFARAAGVASWERRDAVESMLRVVDLYDTRNRPVQDLSLGLTRRLALARALVHNPALLILDDPLLGLDGRGRLEIREVLRELGQMQITLIVASHLLADVADLCPDVLVLNDGRVSYVGPMTAVLATATRPQQRVRLRIVDGLEEANALLDLSSTVREVTTVERDLTFLFIGDDDALADLLEQLVEAGVRVAQFGHGAEAMDELSAGLAEITVERMG